MQPLLFIIILTVALVALTYLTLTWAQPRDPDIRIQPRRRFAFEAAPELFRYIEPDLYLAPNSIKLSRISPAQISIYWRLSREHWGNKERSSKQLAREGKLTLRLYRNADLLEIEDIAIGQTSGSRQFDLADDCSCCASLGVKEDERFTPWLFSNTLMRDPGMESHGSRLV